MQYRQSVAVNVRLLLSGRLEGIGYFTHETLRRITSQNPDVHFWFLFDRPFSSEFVYGSNVTPVVLFPQARHPLLYVWWFEWSVARWLNKHKPDLFLSPDGHGVLRSAVPQVLVMHDLAYEHFPKHMSLLQNQYFKYFMPRFAHHAAQLATVSEYSKADICKYYNISSKKVDVVYSGVKEFFTPASETIKTNMRNKFASGKEYFVYVGSVNPRKNVANILRAFDLFKTQTGSDIKLVIAGAKGWKTSEIFDVWDKMKFKEEVVFTGRLEEAELVQVLAAAQVSLYPSLFEGFGVPPLEAMACGVPVITSNVSSLPEISGDAALYVSPENVPDIAAKMIALSANEHLRASLIEKGFVHYKQHTWDRTAHLLWQSCLKVLGLDKRL